VPQGWPPSTPAAHHCSYLLPLLYSDTCTPAFPTTIDPSHYRVRIHLPHIITPPWPCCYNTGPIGITPTHFYHPLSNLCKSIHFPLF
jgi:hypothetical protein